MLSFLAFAVVIAALGIPLVVPVIWNILEGAQPRLR